MSLSITPIHFSPSTPLYTSTPSIETQVNQLEREAEELVQSIPKAKQPAFRLMIQKQLGFIRSQIAQMRADRKTEYEINRVLPELFENFHAAKAKFNEGNELYATTQSLVWEKNNATANKINQCIQDTHGFERESSLQENDEPDYFKHDLSNRLPAKQSPPKVDQSLGVASARFLRDRAVENVVRARVVTEAGGVVGTVIKETAKTLLGCRGEEGQKNCEAVFGYAKTVVKETAATVLGCRGEGRTNCKIVRGYVKKVAEKVKPTLTRMTSGQAFTQRLGELGIDAEKSDEWFHLSAQQYIEDCNSLRFDALLGGGMTGASRLYKTVVSKGNHLNTPSTKPSSLGKRLISKQLECQIESATETLTLTNKEKGKITTQKSHPTFALAPESSPLFQENPRRGISPTVFATSLARKETVVPRHIDVKNVLDQELLSDYLGTHRFSPVQEFIHKNIRQPFTTTVVENSGSGNTLHIVRDITGNPIAFVKEFSKTRCDDSGFIPEIISLSILHAENLRHSSLPTLVDVGMYKTPHGQEKGLLMYPYLHGHTLEDLFKARLPIPAKKVGQAFGEIGAVESPLPVLDQYIKEKALDLSGIAQGVFFRLNELGISTPLTMKRVEMIINDMKTNPGRAGLVHGDACPNNMIVNNGKVIVLDSGTLVASVNRVGMPYGMPVFDQQRIAVSMYHLGARFKYSRPKVEKIVAEYLTGYRELMPDTSEPAERFARLYHEVMDLNDLVRGQYDKRLLGDTVERVNHVYGQTHVKSVDKKMAPSQIGVAKEPSPLTAERLNRVYAAPIYFPPAAELKITQLEQLHDIWSQNQQTLLGILLKEQIPSFGLHGTGYIGTKTILNRKTAISERGNFLWVAGIPYRREPLNQLGALCTIVEKATKYLEKKGRIFIVDTSTAVATGEGIFERAKLIPLDSRQQRHILGKVEGLSHADQLHVPFTQDNYSRVVKGVILEEETLYPEELIHSLRSNETSSSWGILAERLRIQETLMTVLEKLGVIKDFDSCRLEMYHEAGKALWEASE